MKLTDLGPTLKTGDIEKFEESLNVSLPEYFKEFYNKFNGGDPSHPHFKNYEISYFLSINHYNANLDIVETMENLKLAKRLPPDFVPFARDGGGWVFGLLIKSKDNCGVRCLTNGMGEDKTRFLASSFKEFIENCSIEDDY